MPVAAGPWLDAFIRHDPSCGRRAARSSAGERPPGRNRRRVVLAGALTVAALTALGLGPATPRAAAGTALGSCPTAPSVAATPDAGLDASFAAYAATGHGWAGGDGAYSVALPDGRSAWLFSDSYVNTGQTPVHMVHNTILLQSSAGALDQTLFSSGPSGRPAPFVSPPSVGRATFFWPLGEVVQNGQLSVMLTMEHGKGAFRQRWLGTDVATLSLPGLQLQRLDRLSTTSVRWGQWVASAGDGYVYVYGKKAEQAFVARLPATAALWDQSQWSYWDGSAWDADQSLAAPIVSGILDEFSVTHVGSTYVMVDMEGGANATNGYVDVQFACSPEGPFGGAQRIYDTPLRLGRVRVLAYAAHVQPQLTTSAGNQTTLVVSYSVDTFGGPPPQPLYRPHFLDVSLTW